MRWSQWRPGRKVRLSRPPDARLPESVVEISRKGWVARKLPDPPPEKAGR